MYEASTILGRNRIALTILLLGLATAVAIRLQGAANKDGLAHDEAISLIAATGHQKAFSDVTKAGEHPVAHWVDVLQWKRFLRIDEPFCFRRIASDLARSDIHPPLYFWILHVWLWITGVEIWAGPYLNIGITIATAMTLYGFARYLLEDPRQASTVVLLWAASPYVMRESLEARPYGLLALLAVALVWRTVALAAAPHRASVRGLAALALITWAGALTHGHFAVVASGAAVYTTLTLAYSDPVRLVKLLMAYATGYGLFFLAHPGFSSSLSRQQSQAQPFDFTGASDRALRIASCLGQAFLPARVGPTLLLLGVTGLAVAALIVFWRRHSTALRPIADHVSAMCFFLAWFLGTTTVLYLLFLSPEHAMGPRYLSPVWPMLVFVPVLLTRLLPRHFGSMPLAALCVWQLGYAAGAAAAAARWNAGHVTQASLFAGARNVVVDSVARGVLPRIVLDVPVGTPVYAAPQVALLKVNTWQPGLGPGTIYVSSMAYENTEAAQAELLRRIQARHATRDLKGGQGGFRYVLVE
jgi:hypothetical protein